MLRYHTHTQNPNRETQFIYKACLIKNTHVARRQSVGAFDVHVMTVLLSSCRVCIYVHTCKRIHNNNSGSARPHKPCALNFGVIIFKQQYTQTKKTLQQHREQHRQHKKEQVRARRSGSFLSSTLVRALSSPSRQDIQFF